MNPYAILAAVAGVTIAVLIQKKTGTPEETKPAVGSPEHMEKMRAARKKKKKKEAAPPVEAPQSDGEPPSDGSPVDTVETEEPPGKNGDENNVD